MRLSRTIAGTALATVAIAAAGCGGQDPAAGVRSTLGRFGRAAAQKDYRAMCTRLLAPVLVEQVESVGMPCEAALAKGLGGVSSPTLRVRKVTVRKGRAFAIVHSAAAGQAPSTDVVQLVRERDGWRIASLGTQRPAPVGAQTPPDD
jgi:hypothetical protein